MTYPAATANLVVLWGRWWDHLTKAGVDATITATPLLATGQAGSGSPNLVSLVDQAEIKTAAWSTKPLPGSGLWALPLLPTNDAQFGAFGGYRIQAGSEPPFIVEILENTPTMVMSADMIAALNAARTQSNAAPIGISVSDVVQAVWVRQAAVLQQPAVAPPAGVLTSDQVVNLVAGVRQLPLGGTPGQVPTPKAGGGYEWTTPAAASSGLDAEGVRDTVGDTLAAGPGARVLVDDPNDRILLSAVGDLPEATQNARTSAIASALDLLDKTNTYRGTVTQSMPEALPGRVAAFRQETVGLTLTPATPASGTPDVFVLADGSTATSLSPTLPGELVTLRCTHAGRWRAINIVKPQSALDARHGRAFGVAATLADGSTDAAAAIQAQLDAAEAAGGGVVRIPTGTYLIGATLSIASRVLLVGDGMGASVLKLKANTNADLLRTKGFAGLTGGSSIGGPEKFGVARLTLDANRAQNTSGWCMRIYGKAYRIDQVIFTGGASGGCWSEWAGPATPGRGTEMEPLWHDFHITDHLGVGLDWRGPHDGQLTDGIISKASTVARGSYAVMVNASSGNGGGNPVFTDVHAWGDYDVVWYLDTQALLVNCQGDGGIVGVMAGAQGVTIIGGCYYGTRVRTEYGIQIGDATHLNVQGVTIDTFIFQLDANSWPIYVHSSGGQNRIRATVRGDRTTGLWVGGSAVSTDLYEVIGGGDAARNHIRFPSGSQAVFEGGWYSNGKAKLAVPGQASALTIAGASDLFNINTQSPRAELINGAPLRGFSDGYTTATVEISPANGAVRPGTTAGRGAQIFSGSGAPTVSATAGDIYFRTDTPGVANQRVYICTGGTSWTGIV